MGMNLFDLRKNAPLALDGLDQVTDPDAYNRVMHEAIRKQLIDGGQISPTSGVTNFNLDNEMENPSWMDKIMESVFSNDPEAGDEPGRDTYLQRRFEFISGHEGFRSETYRDSRNLRTVGYGFNLEEPTNRALFKKALGKTDKDFDNLRDGKDGVDQREGRILFEAAAGEAEKLISRKFKDQPLKGYERLALVSMAYNHPALIGPNLTKLLRAGDKKGVVDEIVHRSNLHKSKGIQNRRGFEAEMFTGMHVDEQEDKGWSLASLLGISTAEASSLQSSDELISEGRDSRPSIGEQYRDLVTNIQTPKSAAQIATAAGASDDAEPEAETSFSRANPPDPPPEVIAAMKRETGEEESISRANPPDPPPEVIAAMKATSGTEEPASASNNISHFLSGILPSNVRALVQDLTGMGVEKTDVRNADWFSKNEAATVRRVTLDKIKKSGKKRGSVEYKDYQTGQKDVSFGGSASTVMFVADTISGGASSSALGEEAERAADEFVIKTTLGAYQYYIDFRGHLIVIDQYNFNDAKRLQKANPTTYDKILNLAQYTGSGQVGAYGLIRRIGALWGSKEGDGAKFELDLGPVSQSRFL